MKNTIKMLVLSAFVALATSGYSQATENNWVFGIGGGGSTSTKASGGSMFGLSVDIGREGVLWLPIQSGLRQSIAYANVEGSQTLLTTTLYNDWTIFKHKNLDLFAGANIGVTYGNTQPLWALAPEVGLRWWLKDDIAVVGRIEYGFDLNNNAKQQDMFGYQIGLQFTF